MLIFYMLLCYTCQ